MLELAGTTPSGRPRCQAVTRTTGQQCSRAAAGNLFCLQHGHTALVRLQRPRSSINRPHHSTVQETDFEILLQCFPDLAATIMGLLEQHSKKALRICSRACKAAVDPSLTHVTARRVSLLLLQSPNWRHLQKLGL
jgi:hypothetical protein